MRKFHWARLVALLIAGALLVALVVPTVAFAAVGGPYSESVSNPEDNGICPVPPDGGDSGIGTSSRVRIIASAGAVSAPLMVNGTVWNVSGGKNAPDGGVMRTVIELTPDGFVFNSPITLSCTYSPSLTNPRAYGWDTGTGQWTPLASHVVGNRVEWNTTHFSSYGIGGDPALPVPASSNWSIGLLAIAGLGIAGIAVRRFQLN